MSESVSKAAEARRESDWEKNRKPESPNSGKTQNPNTNCGRAEQHRTSVGEGQLNVGSNQNIGRKHESEDAPEHKPQGGFGYTEDQTKRSHSQAPVVEEGAVDNRSTKKTGVAERHVTSQPGFDVAKRRSGSVRSNRSETEKVFDSRQKKSSSV